MPVRALATRVLPVIAVVGVLALSWYSAGKVHINANLVACAGYGTGYGYTLGPPSVTDVNFALSPSVGGETVTITGQGYCSPATAVTFGATPASSFTINSDVSITAQTPAHAVGVVDVTVTNAQGTSAPNAGSKFGFIKSAVYTMDGFGGFHPDDSSAITGEAYWAGFRIARAAHAWPAAGATQQGFTLDGYGGLHTYGPATPAFSETNGSSGHYWNGFDIARDFAFLPNGTGGVVLDGDGGLHPFGINGNAAPTVSGYSYFGFDVAIKVVIFSDGTGGYTLDAYGGVHPFALNGNAQPAAPTGYGYWGWRAAADMVLVSGTHGGYQLDKYGGAHPFGAGTAPAAITTSYFGFDIARGIFLLPGSTSDGFTLDGYGGPHPFGNAPKMHTFPYWSGYDIATTIFGA